MGIGIWSENGSFWVLGGLKSILVKVMLFQFKSEHSHPKNNALTKFVPDAEGNNDKFVTKSMMLVWIFS